MLSGYFSSKVLHVGMSLCNAAKDDLPAKLRHYITYNHESIYNRVYINFIIYILFIIHILDWFDRQVVTGYKTASFSHARFVMIISMTMVGVTMMIITIGTYFWRGWWLAYEVFRPLHWFYSFPLTIADFADETIAFCICCHFQAAASSTSLL